MMVSVRTDNNKTPQACADQIRWTEVEEVWGINTILQRSIFLRQMVYIYSSQIDACRKKKESENPFSNTGNCQDCQALPPLTIMVAPYLTTRPLSVQAYRL